MSRQLAATRDTVLPGATTLEAPAPVIRRRRPNYAPYLLLAPSLLFLVVFFAWPMVESLLLAFEGAGGVWSAEPIQRMASDLAFWEAIRNTLLLTAIVVPAQVILALTMSLLLMSGLR